MPNSPKRRAYLVSVSHKQEAVHVYAVLTIPPEEALEIIALTVSPKAHLEIVGGLSRELVKRLRLKPREPLQV